MRVTPPLDPHASAVPEGASTAALPVEVAVDGAVGVALRSHVEGVLGWQALDESMRALVPPVARFVDAGSPVEVAGPPTVLILSAGTPPHDAAMAALRHRPAAVLAWPEERQDLAEVVATAAAASRSEVRGSVIRVGGVCGGVGTTTVALAVAGLCAWRGSATLAIVSGPAHLSDVVRIVPDDLAGPRVWAAARPAPGVPGLRVVRCDGAAGLAPPADVQVVVHDVGVDVDADVSVLRRDAAGLAALDEGAAAVAVIVDVGPVPAAAFTRALGGRRAITLPWSARVARAAVAGRVPAGLPGAWIRALSPVVTSGGRP